MKAKFLKVDEAVVEVAKSVAVPMLVDSMSPLYVEVAVDEAMT